MSSHHIVRDEQEPALFVLDAKLLGVEAIAELLEWSPTILLPYDQLEQFVSFGLKPDVLLVAPNEFSQEAGFPLFDAHKVEIPHSDFVAAGFSWFLNNGYRAVNVLGLPTQLMEETSLANSEMELVFYDETSRWLWLQNGQYRKWLPAESSIVVYPARGGAEIQLEGFGDCTGQLFLSESRKLKATTEGLVKVSSSKPFLVKEPL